MLLAKEVPRARLARQLPRPIAGSGALPLLPRPSPVRPHAPPALLHRLSQARARGPFRCQRQRTPLLAPGTNPSQSQGQGSARPAARSREGGSSPRVATAARTPQALVSRGHGLNMVSKREQRTRPSLPPPRPPLGTPPRCPPRAGGRQGGGALGRAVPAARCPLASGLRGLSVSSRSSRAFCLPEPALPDEPGAGCTTCGLLPIRPPGLKICDARKLTKFSTGHFTPHENPPHYQTRIPPWVTRAVSARRCRPGLG